jgi:hypothetical protein
MARLRATALLVVLAASLTACGDDEPSATPGPDGKSDLAFTKSGGCADAFFWATTSDDEHAIAVSVELSDRSASDPTVFKAELPDPDVEVELWEGTHLTSRMCNDVVQGDVTGQTPVVEGSVTITVQPRPREPGNLTDGKAEFTGLVAEDGTELPDVEIKTTYIGFYAG